MMDEELKHILCEIDNSFSDIALLNKRLGTKFNNYNSLAYIADLDRYKWKVYNLNVYCRALRDKMNDSYNKVIQNIDNGDMI
jgi:hypothetical protein